MSANGISTLQYKRDRQVAKLNLAQQNRLADSNARASYDITQLPTLYAENNNNTNDVVDNLNLGGLVLGRPWVNDPEVIVNNIKLENGDDFLLENNNFILLEI